MKIIFTALAFLLSIWCQAQGIEKIQIPPSEASIYRLSQNNFNQVMIKNTSDLSIQVEIFQQGSNQKSGGFGLSAKGKTAVDLDEDKYLRLVNNNPTAVILELKQRKQKQQKEVNEERRIQLTLLNSSARSIPLIIPTVMNPNLSPFSRSGVSLTLGQKIYLKKGMHRQLLFEVTDSLAQGTELDISELVRTLNP